MDNSYINYKKHLKDFIVLYRTKPLSDNTGGMKFPHMFATYCLLKELNPKLVLESGVWYGQGTWLIENALPECQIICMDPIDIRKYISPNSFYTSDDITTIDWNHFIEGKNLTPDDVVVFLDDHQNVLNRLEFLKTFTNLKHILCEDNYPSSQGDCLSPKKLKMGGEYILDTPQGKSIHPSPKNESEYLNSITDIYREFPPIIKPTHTRWGDLWEDVKYPTLPPIYSDMPDYLEDFEPEFKDYTWFCYLKLN